MFKRFFLFFGVNIAIIATISLILNLLGFSGYITSQGLNYESLAIFCLIWGMAGSFISLRLSKWMAKKLMGVEIVSPTGQYGPIVQKVHQLASRAGLPSMPEVGIYRGDEINAFATGPSKSNSLVAVSTGLLNKMNDEEIEGVLAHEVAHIANGDMVTMALLQGVLNAFVMFAARVAAYAISNVMRGEDDEGGGFNYLTHFIVVFVLEIFFGIFASIIVAWFSRFREFRADAGAGNLAGKDRMIAALEALKKNYNCLSKGESSIKTMQISSQSSFMALFSSHPSLDRRIAALRGF